MTKQKITIDIDSFTVGDFLDFEDVADVPLTDAMRSAAPKKQWHEDGTPVMDPETGEQAVVDGSVPMKAMLALLWIAQRKDGVTLEQVRDQKISKLDIEFIGGEDEADSGNDAGA